jgi:hypothetical protein
MKLGMRSIWVPCTSTVMSINIQGWEPKKFTTYNLTIMIKSDGVTVLELKGRCPLRRVSLIVVALFSLYISPPLPPPSLPPSLN